MIHFLSNDNITDVCACVSIEAGGEAWACNVK